LIATAGALFAAGAARADESRSLAVAVPAGPEAFRAIEWATPAQVHPGSLVEVTVLTSDDIGYVELHVRTWSVNLDKLAPGKFRLHYRVPLLPPAALGNWNIDLIAHSMGGVAVKRVYHVTYRYF
jgi:hypothetical protein